MEGSHRHQTHVQTFRPAEHGYAASDAVILCIGVHPYSLSAWRPGSLEAGLMPWPFLSVGEQRLATVALARNSGFEKPAKSV